MKRLLLNLFLISLVFSTVFAQNPKYSIENSPKWKKQIPFKPDNIDFSESGETSYILIDWQENEVSREYNYRYCMRLNNESGVQNNSQLYFSFDPSYQQLGIHRIVLHRNGQTINQLNPDQIEVMRNEKSADRLIYDGTYSALAILHDVRVGDILEYEFTLKGKNPILGKHIYANHQLAYDQAVHHLYKCSLVPSNQNIHYCLHGDATAPEMKEEGSLTRYEWDLNNIRPIFADGGAPSWYDIYPYCEISSFSGWDEVKEWENNLFDHSVNSPAIDQFLKEKQYATTEGDLIKIIRFVQDDVRYLGMEMGSYSHRPHHPEKIFKQRFGDCKDKSYLLSAMLRKTGFEAWPALVNTLELGHIDQRIPSPFVFNHVIVKFRWKGETFWVDPTISQQKGGLAYLCFPECYKALVLDDGPVDFEEIPLQHQDRVVIQEHYWFTDSVSDASYQVITNYYGYYANTKRSMFKNNSLPQIRDNYLSFYSNYLNGIKWENDSSLLVSDSPETNSFKTTENYLVKDVWKKNTDDNPELYATINPFNLYEFLSYSKDQDRNMPLHVLHPVSIDQTISLHLPRHKDISLKDEADSIVNDIFRFNYSTTVDRTNHAYHIHLTYETLANHVPVEKLDGYFKNYNQLSDMCLTNITWGNGISGFRLFVPALILALIFVGLMTLLFVHLYRDDMGFQPIPQLPEAFGGWLVLPIIGLHLTPIMVVAELFQINYFNKSLWENILRLKPDMAGFMEAAYFFELLFNIGLIAFSGFLIFMLYQKRATFPKLYIWFRITALVFLLFDLIVIADLFEAEKDYKEIVKETLNAAIWVPYFFISKRVKNTFTKTYASPAPSSENIEPT
jgi:hypothetical protein